MRAGYLTPIGAAGRPYPLRRVRLAGHSAQNYTSEQIVVMYRRAVLSDDLAGLARADARDASLSHRATIVLMTSSLAEWEASIDALWERSDALGREEGVALMRTLAENCPAGDGRAAFELAGMYDSLGFEAEAGAEYERALSLGLDEARHAQLAVQYGSTLRNLGRLEEAIAVLEEAPLHESTGSAPRVVLALALHSAGRKDEALRVALEAQIDSLPRYQRSMRNYAAALTSPAGGI